MKRIFFQTFFILLALILMHGAHAMESGKSYKSPENAKYISLSRAYFDNPQIMIDLLPTLDICHTKIHLLKLDYSFYGTAQKICVKDFESTDSQSKKLFVKSCGYLAPPYCKSPHYYIYFTEPTPDAKSISGSLKFLINELEFKISFTLTRLKEEGNRWQLASHTIDQTQTD